MDKRVGNARRASPGIRAGRQEEALRCVAETQRSKHIRYHVVTYYWSNTWLLLQPLTERHSKTNTAFPKRSVKQL